MTPTLSKRFRFCISDQKAVFVDLTSGQYFCLEEDMESTFLEIIRDPASYPSYRSRLTGLIDSEVLIEDGTGAPLVDTPLALTPIESLLDSRRDKVGVWHIIGALIEQLNSAIDLKARGLNSVLRNIEARKSSAKLSGRDGLRFGTAALLASQRLMPSDKKCLRRSIALVRHLARRGYVSTLVVGIRMRPFGAHAWVQHGTVVLNDSVEEVAKYTPILAV